MASMAGNENPRLHGRIRLRAVPMGIVAVILAVAVTLPGASAAQRKTGSALMVDAVKNKLGTILVTTKGQTLYRYRFDSANKVACAGQCANAFPPLLLPAGVTHATGGKGVTGLGTVKNPNGNLQVTFKGHPLYRFAGDKKAGRTGGQGFAKDWFVVTTNVAVGTEAPATTNTVSPATSTATSGTSPTPTTSPSPTTSPPTTSTPSTTTTPPRAPTTTTPYGAFGF